MATSWPNDGSPWRKPCCGPRTWRSSCERGREATPEAERRVEIANEFAAVTVTRVETRNGVRLRIESARLQRSIDLDPLELESLTWQSHDLFTGFLAEPFGPEDE